MSFSNADVISLFAAAIAAAALSVSVWQALQNRPHIRLRVSAGMIVMGSEPDEDQGSFIISSAANIGAQPTTITGFGFEAYDTWWGWLIGQRAGRDLVGTGGRNSVSVPHVLEPGREARFFFSQDDRIAAYVKSHKIVMAWVAHTWSAKAKTYRLRQNVREKIIGGGK